MTDEPVKHYFGAYLQIEVVGYQNGEFPTLIEDVLPHEQFEDVLEVITPYILFNTGVIIAIGNSDKPAGEWLTISSDAGQNEEYLKQFPTEAGIRNLTYEFIDNYAEIIAELNKSPLVKSAVVRFGYVLDGGF